MKKLQLSTLSVSPGASGGIGNTSYYLAKEFSKKYDFTVVTGENYIEEEKKYPTFKTKSSYKNLKTFILETVLLSFKLNKKKSDRANFILCTHWVCAIGSFIVKKIYKIPYGIMVHGNEIYTSDSKSEKLKMKLLSILQKKAIENANLIFVNSAYTKDLFSSHYINNNIHIIHPCIEYIEQSNFSTKPTDNILSIGRIVKRKGFQNVLRAMPDILNQKQDLKYIIAGDGEYLSRLKEITNELHLENNVIFKGYITEKEKRELYKGCDFFVMPSIEVPEENSIEGFGIVYIEANMFGKFVIGCDSGGISDAIINQKTGALLRENNIDDISDTILDLYKNWDLRHVNVCKQWARNHDYKKIGRKYIELMEAECSLPVR